MKREIIHICQDEKFIELAKYQFNALYAERNTYLIVVKDKSEPLRYVQEDTQTKIIERDELVDIADKLPAEAIIIFHSLVHHFYAFINNLAGHHTLIWVFFGMEVYNDKNLYSRKKLYAPLTYQLFSPKKISVKKQLKNKLRPYVRLIKPSLAYNKLEEEKALFKKKKEILDVFDYIGLLYKEDFDYISKLGKIKNTNHFFYTYYPLEKIVDVTEDITEPKNRIMLGNSGHPASNHFDVLKKISGFNLEYEEVFLPLSYGIPSYIQKIEEEAPKILPIKVNCLTDFLPLEKYNLILRQVKVFILYTRRQQGVGNVIALLWHGAKVFLSEKNTFYHFLKRIGVHIYCYETELNENSINAGLSVEEIKHNRALLHDHLNEKYLLEQLKKQLDPILAESRITNDE